MKQIIKNTLLIVFSVLTLLNNVNAKTEGNYLGFGIVKHDFGKFQISKIDKKFEYISGEKITDLYFSYKYAFNYNNFILAPQITYTPGLGKADFETYEGKINIGYDVFIILQYLQQLVRI